jgi:hypothetical protein
MEGEVMNRALDQTGVERAARASLNRARSRQVVVLLCGLTAGIIGLGLVGLSPLALRELGTTRGLNWVRLGDIGQAYGAVATLLAALALVGVTAAFFVQARQTRISAEQAARTIHFELVRLAIDNPDLRAVVAGYTDDEASNKVRQLFYANLWITYWRTTYRLKYDNEKTVRLGLASELFTSVEGRELWKGARAGYYAHAIDRRTLKFCRIVDDEYAKADSSTGLPSSPAIAPSPSVVRSARRAQCSAVAFLSVGAGVAIYRILIRCGNRKNLN